MTLVNIFKYIFIYKINIVIYMRIKDAIFNVYLENKWNTFINV